MDKSDEISIRAQQLIKAARDYSRPLPRAQAKLEPYSEGILELRSKGASITVIKELLITINVRVSASTIIKFLAEKTEKVEAKKTSKKPRPSNIQSSSTEDSDAGSIPSVPLANSPSPRHPIERSRNNGPRIADPQNL